MNASSIYRSKYIKGTSNRMRSVYINFQRYLDQIHPFKSRFPVCNQLDYIHIMRPLYHVF